MVIYQDRDPRLSTFSFLSVSLALFTNLKFGTNNMNDLIAFRPLLNINQTVVTNRAFPTHVHASPKQTCAAILKRKLVKNFKIYIKIIDITSC